MTRTRPSARHCANSCCTCWQERMDTASRPRIRRSLAIYTAQFMLHGATSALQTFTSRPAEAEHPPGSEAACAGASRPRTPMRILHDREKSCLGAWLWLRCHLCLNLTQLPSARGRHAGSDTPGSQALSSSHRAARPRSGGQSLDRGSARSPSARGA